MRTLILTLTILVVATATPATASPDDGGGACRPGGAECTTHSECCSGVCGFVSQQDSEGFFFWIRVCDDDTGGGGGGGHRAVPRLLTTLPGSGAIRSRALHRRRLWADHI